nr:Hpt domain-containing protein [Methylomonas koyamae]
MESGLLHMDIGDVDAEDINTIFRAAHSIKGGSGTFGFTAVSDFTHVMETLLDEMRDAGARLPSRPSMFCSARWIVYATCCSPSATARKSIKPPSRRTSWRWTMNCIIPVPRRSLSPWQSRRPPARQCRAMLAKHWKSAAGRSHSAASASTENR